MKQFKEIYNESIDEFKEYVKDCFIDLKMIVNITFNRNLL
jgi:hypothetical protein